MWDVDDQNEDALERDESAQDFGPCCICEETGPQVRNGLLLSHPGAIEGRGWGCFTCGLPPVGAVALLCDACFEAYKAREATLRFFCAGWPEDGRRPIAELPREPFTHDESKHHELWDEDDDTHCPYCGEAGCERSCTGAILADEGEDEG
jgi:hypothetical protein